MQPTMRFIRCSAFEVATVITQLKADKPALYWGLSDELPSVSQDSNWVGLGCYKVTITGKLWGYFTAYIIEGGRIGLSHVVRIPGTARGFLATVLDWLAAVCPGDTVAIDCFATVHHAYADLGFTTDSTLPFNPLYAPLSWSGARDGYPAVLLMSRRLPGSNGTGSY